MNIAADEIRIEELEVWFRVGVPDAERACPQRLLISLTLTHDFSGCVQTDDLAGTVDYAAVAAGVARLGEGRSWRLIEKLADDIARYVLEEFRPRSVTVDIRKFILPGTRCVAVRVTRS
jgi:dihydroneopterin aldolase